MSARRGTQMAAAAALLLPVALAIGPRFDVALAREVVAAPSIADTLRLSVDEAVARALSQGQEIHIANSQVDVADAQVRQALSEALPQINGSLTYGRQFASIYQSLAGDTSGIASLFKNSPFGSPNSWNAELTGSQLLWSGGRIAAGLSAARAYRASNRADRDETAANIRARVQRAYLEAVYSREVLAISRMGLDQARAHLTEVAEYQKEGSRSEYDLIRAQVDAANEEPPVVTASNAVDLAMFNLKRLLNVPLEQPLELTTTLTFPDRMVPVVADENNEPTGRAALIRADADVEARKQLVRVQKAGYWPSLTLSGTLSQQAFPQIERPTLDQFHRSLTAQLRLDLPIFTGFKVSGAVAQANAELRQAEYQRDQERENVEIEVAQARLEARRMLAELLARDVTAGLAQRAHYLADVRYKNGLSTQLEVSDARLQMQTAQINEAEATKNYRLALLELERALGHPLPLVKRPLDELTAAQTEEER